MKYITSVALEDGNINHIIEYSDSIHQVLEGVEKYVGYKDPKFVLLGVVVNQDLSLYGIKSGITLSSIVLAVQVVKFIKEVRG